MSDEEYEKRSVRRFWWTIVMLVANIVIVIASVTINVFTIKTSQDKATCNAMMEKINEPMATPSETIAITNVQNSR